MPFFLLLLEIVEFAGGKWLGVVGGKIPPPSASEKATLVLSCKEDLGAFKKTSEASPPKKGRSRSSAAAAASAPGGNVYEPELLLSGVLRKKLDFKEHAIRV